MQEQDLSRQKNNTRILILEIPRLPPTEKRTHRLDQAGVWVIRRLLDDSSMPHHLPPTGPHYLMAGTFPESHWLKARHESLRTRPTCNAHPHAIGIHRVGAMISIFTCCEDWFEIPRDEVSDPLLLGIEDGETFLKALLEWVDEHESGLHRGGAHE